MKQLEIKGARVIKGRRIMLGFSQQQMAELINKSKSSYVKKESGEVPFSINEAILVADKLGLDLEDFNEVFLGGQLKQESRDKIHTDMRS